MRYPIWLEYYSTQCVGFVEVEDEVPMGHLVHCALVPAIKRYRDGEAPDEVTGFGLVRRERVDTRPLKETKRANRP